MASLRDEIGKRIERKQQEIKELELQVREAYAYIQGLQEMTKLLPKDNATDGAAGAVTLRPGSDMAKAQEAIRRAGAPLHLLEILKVLGKGMDKKSRVAVGGSLARYARNRQVFIKTHPNTFGLLGLHSPTALATPEPPDDFGKDE